ncbi:MAG TPA: hypothetical protein VGB73_13035 [Pyrinomonadaceae bacterium]|jgi:hypothetical protein
MSIKHRQLFSLFVASVLLLGGARLSFACGPYSLEAAFTFSKHPDFPLERFARGEIGVLQPTYARSYLYAAYRQMSGASFNNAEQSALSELWKERIDYAWERKGEDWIQKWREARKRVAGVAEVADISVFRSREKPNDYETYLNCQDDAFRTATATLEERIKKFGAESPVLKEWVAAQDLVFANCSEGERIPSAAEPGADPLLRADRAYQIAAANFYAARFDEARKAFEEIAADASSPWRAVAPYLAARALLRKGSLGQESLRAESLSAAEKQLQKILDDRSLSATHRDARRLLNLVRLRLRPEEKLHELARDLLKRDAQGNFKQDVWDYTLLLDKFLKDDEGDPDERMFKNVPAHVRGDDLSDWVTTFQIRDDEALEHSLRRWETSAALPWLVAALSKVGAKHPKTAGLVEAAAKVGADSPAYATVVFHSARLLREAGREEEARSRLDAALSRDAARLPVSAHNRLLGQRMLLARSLEEFLRFAQRTPTALSWNEDGRELPADASEVEANDRAKVARGRTLFDDDAAAILNAQFPLALLKQAAMSEALPEHLRRELALAAWVRSLLLEDRETGRELVPLVESLVPELKGYLSADLDASTDEARKFNGLYALLKFPGMQPHADSGIGRTTPINSIDSYRDNWWCVHTPQETQTSSADGAVAGAQTQSAAAKPANNFPSFLNARQRAQAAREVARIEALGTAPNFLARLAVEWANKSPDDPRVPEALHLAVRSTRYGCSDAGTGALSKAAFQTLHKRYPKSEWAKKTPYWFNG